jgi:hypothetical protein
MCCSIVISPPGSGWPATDRAAKMSAFRSQVTGHRSQVTGRCLCVGVLRVYRRFEAPDLDPYVTRETLQEMGSG